MKKRILIILLACLCLTNLFCADKSVKKNAQSDTNSKIVITGYVISTGNVPFVYPAIKGDDENNYVIICTEKQKRRLLDSQGKHLRFTLVKNDEVSWIVKKFKVIK